MCLQAPVYTYTTTSNSNQIIEGRDMYFEIFSGTEIVLLGVADVALYIGFLLLPDPDR